MGVLVNGFPRESSYGVEIGGIRTNFRMPDLVTIALGGGTVVAADPAGVRIGPRSVGYRLRQEALVFGGGTATLTDSAVAAGRAGLGDPRLAAGQRELLAEALAQADVMLADAIDRMKTSRDDCPLIAVGGGSILIPDRIPGVSEVIRPEHFDTANAVGAAIASVSGQIDRIFHLGSGGRQAALDEACGEARERAVAAGAEPGTVRIVEMEEIPLAYLTSPAVRIRAKAAGTLGGLPGSQREPTDAVSVTSQEHGGIHEGPPRRAAGSRAARCCWWCWPPVAAHPSRQPSSRPATRCSLTTPPPR